MSVVFSSFAKGRDLVFPAGDLVSGSSASSTAADFLVYHGSEDDGRVRELLSLLAVPGRMLLLRPFNNVCVFGVSWQGHCLFSSLQVPASGESREADEEGRG
ncbi:unnamed protein product [Urochloa humidicola]